MSRFNTGNPLDSDRLEDLSDNAKNLDVLVNSKTSLTQTDRLGAERKTWHGMEKYVEQSISFAGYVFSGDYASGVTLTSYNQIVRDGSGEFWRASGSTDLPYTLTGTGVDEGGALVSVGDAALRDEFNTYTAQNNTDIANLNAGVKSATSAAAANTKGIATLNAVNRAGSVHLASQKKPTNPYGMKGAVNILGDSISHGAFAPNLFYDGWTRIFSRMLNGESGGSSYHGFVPMLDIGAGVNLSKDIVSYSFIGAWEGLDSSTSSAASACPNGLAMQTVKYLDHIFATIPTFQSYCVVWYLQQPGGGSLRVADNTGELSVISTDGELAVKNQIVALVDDGSGSATVITQKSDDSVKPVSVLGFGFIDGATYPTVFNFSQSGRRLRYVSESVISECTNNAAMLVLALGHNDQFDVDADASGPYRAEFKKRIDWIIQYCNANKTLLVVPDFCWTAADTSHARSELKRAAFETGGIYIPMPNLLKPDGSVPTVSYLVDTLGMWVEGSHPNASGQKWIAETVAKYIGLACNTKKGAIERSDYWMPMALTAPLKNAYTSPTVVSAYRYTNGAVQYRYAVKATASGSFPAGTYTLQTEKRFPAPFSIDSTGITGVSMVRADTSAPVGTFSVAQDGTFSLYTTDGTYTDKHTGAAFAPASCKV